jgi:hypothetical protein
MEPEVSGQATHVGPELIRAWKALILGLPVIDHPC